MIEFTNVSKVYDNGTKALNNVSLRVDTVSYTHLGGSVGTNACKIAVGMGADVTIMDINIHRLEYLDDIFGSRIQTLYSNDVNVENALKTADLVIGSVLIPGKKAPKIIRRSYLREMRPGSVCLLYTSTFSLFFLLPSHFSHTYLSLS